MLGAWVLIGAWAGGCAETEVKDSPQKAVAATVSDESSGIHSDVKPLMYSVLSEISTIQSYLVDEQKFLDPKNEGEISTHLNELATLSGQVLKAKRLQSLGYRMSSDAIDSHFNELKYAFKSGNKKYARWMLSATPYACASCHTQLPNSPKPLWELKETDLAGTPFERADFLYATRNYNDAERIYTELIRADFRAPAPAHKLDSSQLDVALRRKLTIFANLRRDFKGAVESFKKDLTNKSLPKEQRETIQSWIKPLLQLTKQDPKLAQKPVQLLKYVSNVLEGSSRSFVNANYPKLVEVLNASSLLYQTIHHHPQDELTASLLFWLGVSDLSLNNEPFFSLGPEYLKECMRLYPKALVARRCYAEFEAHVKNIYTGTRGTDIPEEEIQELKHYKELVSTGD